MPAQAPARRATNLSLDPALLDEARSLKVNVSRAAEAGLREAVREARAAAWRAESADAIESSNLWVEANGLPLGACVRSDDPDLMARHDVHPMPDGTGYLLDVQADLLDGLNTRLVVPLLPEAAAPGPARVLNPLVEVAGVRHVMVTQFLSAVPASMLQAPVASLAGRADDITRAIDVATHGF